MFFTFILWYGLYYAQATKLGFVSWYFKYLPIPAVCLGFSSGGTNQSTFVVSLVAKVNLWAESNLAEALTELFL